MGATQLTHPTSTNTNGRRAALTSLTRCGVRGLLTHARLVFRASPNASSLSGLKFISSSFLLHQHSPTPAFHHRVMDNGRSNSSYGNGVRAGSVESCIKASISRPAVQLEAAQAVRAWPPVPCGSPGPWRFG